MPAVMRSTFVVLAAVSAVVVLAGGCVGGEPAEAPTPGSAGRASDPRAPLATASEPRPADTPLPPRPAGERPTPGAAGAAPTAAVGRVQPRPSPTAPRLDLHDSQIVTSVGRMRSTMAPWRDNGGNRLFSTHVFGTPFMLNEKGEALPWIATAITSNEDMTVWTMKLREDAVFQDGTPIMAADFKVYWEHGGKPEHRVTWGGASQTLGDIMGWDELTWGNVTQAEGLRVVDDHTLEIETAVPTPAWPLYMAAWHVGISKLDQMKVDENWGNAPIGAGPYSLTYDPETGLTELVRVDLVGWYWNGPNETPIIEKLVLPNIEDEQARLVMFENGEIDVMMIGTETYEAALAPRHPFNTLLYESPYGGLWFITLRLWHPYGRRALAHGQDMEAIVRAVWGPTATHARGVISSPMPCHNPDANYQPYDPDLARQLLSKPYYSDVPNLSTLMIDLHQPDMLTMAGAMKEYWKDNLGVELDILKREIDGPRREPTDLYATSLGSWIPDPIQIINTLIPWASVRTSNRVSNVETMVEHVRSLPLNDPDRCAWFQVVEQEYLENAYIIPIREVDPIRWVVQPWLVGFESTFNLDFNTLTTAYVARH